MLHLLNKRDEIRDKRFQNNNKYYLINAARSNSVKVIINNYLKAAKAINKRWAIEYFYFQIFGLPPKYQWKDLDY